MVTGKNEKPEDQIDRSLAWMQVALSTIDSIKIIDDQGLQADKARSQYLVALGTGGPAVSAGSMLLLYEVAMALFIGFGPLFILCLLFKQTTQLFQRWLMYGIGTMFSMGVLAAMTTIAMEMVTRVAIAFWGSTLLGKLVGQDFSDGMSSVAMQQGGMGLILTTLILTARRWPRCSSRAPWVASWRIRRLVAVLLPLRLGRRVSRRVRRGGGGAFIPQAPAAAQSNPGLQGAQNTARVAGQDTSSSAVAQTGKRGAASSE